MARLSAYGLHSATHRKGQIKLFTSEITHLGTGRIVARYRSLLIPIVFTIRDLSTREKEREVRRYNAFEFIYSQRIKKNVNAKQIRQQLA